MAAIASVFSSLKSEFEEAKTGLKSVDDNIKRLTGREPGVHIQNPIRRQIEHEPEEQEDLQKKPTLQSSVIATQKEVKPRHQAIEEQKSDKKSMARNKRMFGMILGTLQKFQSEESRRKDITQKRVEIEKKLEQAAADEKETVKKERIELYKVRREKQAQIRRIELKMERVQSHQDWEKSFQFLGSFIQTKTKPHIFYMPVKHTPESEKRLKETKDKYRLIVAEKRAKVQKELTDIDDSYKKETESEVGNENEDVTAEDMKANDGDNGETTHAMEVELDSVGNSNSNGGEIGDAIVKSESNETTNTTKDLIELEKF
ncbi:Pinin-like protein [Leptotrombidium deliense]|uniref:Pinin n=1 Tax=Leptotrombidium deliense TaxID=299467 RepID=A0A443S0K6_9ACAR|nr:Pinin-like protein [Leptotrombidium deliense]